MNGTMESDSAREPETEDKYRVEGPPPPDSDSSALEAKANDEELALSADDMRALCDVFEILLRWDREGEAKARDAQVRSS